MNGTVDIGLSGHSGAGQRGSRCRLGELTYLARRGLGRLPADEEPVLAVGGDGHRRRIYRDLPGDGLRRRDRKLQEGRIDPRATGSLRQIREGRAAEELDRPVPDLLPDLT